MWVHTLEAAGATRPQSVAILEHILQILGPGRGTVETVSHRLDIG